VLVENADCLGSEEVGGVEVGLVPDEVQVPTPIQAPVLLQHKNITYLNSLFTA